MKLESALMVALVKEEALEDRGLERVDKGVCIISYY
jgi:hypothetical protein